MASLWRYDVPIAYRSWYDPTPKFLAYSPSYAAIDSNDDEFLIQAGQLIDVASPVSLDMYVEAMVSAAGYSIAFRLHDITNSRTLCSVNTSGVGFRLFSSTTPIDYYATLSGDIRARFEYASGVDSSIGVAQITQAYVKIKRR